MERVRRDRDANRSINRLSFIRDYTLTFSFLPLLVYEEFIDLAMGNVAFAMIID